MIGDTISMWKIGKQNFSVALIWAVLTFVAQFLIGKVMDRLNLSIPFLGLITYAASAYLVSKLYLKKDYKFGEFMKIIGIAYIINLVIGLLIVGIVGVGILALLGAAGSYNYGLV